MADTGWYDPERGKPDFTILRQPSRSALGMVRGRFGPAAHRYKVDGFTVLVWNRSLLRAPR